MSWFSRFRRRRPTDDYVGRHRPGSWGEAALPPFEAAGSTADPEPVEHVTTAPAPAVVAQAAIPAAPTSPVPSLPVEINARQRVRLGFSDGTSVDIDDESGDSEVFRMAAARLIDDPR